MPPSRRIAVEEVVEAKVLAQKAVRNARSGLSEKSGLGSNLDNILSSKNSEHADFKPIVSEDFLKKWLDFPIGKWTSIGLMLYPFRWMAWTNQSLASMDPGDPTIRERMCSSISVLGMAAGLFLVAAVSAMLKPPVYHTDFEKFLIDLYGIAMYTASLSLTVYIGIALMSVYPLIQSLRDDVAFDAVENYKARWGGYEIYFFLLGFQFLLIGFFLAIGVLFSSMVVWAVSGVFLVIYPLTVFTSVQAHVALDPITSFHLGVTSDPEVLHRAEKMSRYFLRTIPNKILTDGLHHAEQPVSQPVSVDASLGVSAHQNNLSIPQAAPVVVLPSLRSMCKGDNFALQHSGVTADVAARVFDILVLNDCPDTQTLVIFLNESKTFTGKCTCNGNAELTSPARAGRKVSIRSSFDSKDPSGVRDHLRDAAAKALRAAEGTDALAEPSHSVSHLAHKPTCPERKAACWNDALFHLLSEKVPIAQCARIVSFLKPYLQ